MNKYKLIKEYPGSPKLGTITELKSAVNGQIIQGRWCYDIDKTPEFWEKIVEKDYEILTFKNPNIDEIYSMSLKGVYSMSPDNTNFIGDRSLEYCLSFFNIYSVKRLSDGEVFTVGDKIKSYNTIKTIKEINLPKNTPNDIGFITISTNYPGTGYQYLIGDNVKKVKDPLFTTEDGVDIYEGDKYYAITSSYLVLDEVLYANTQESSNYNCIQKGFRQFSTKEAAEEYILMNKPCLSINDIYNRYNYKWSEITVRTLKELIKSKL